MSHRVRHGCGFTLLEVMVSMSILALALTAIAGVNANSFDASNYSKHVTVATLLARSKMIDIEEELRKDGFKDGDMELDGDFDQEGYPGMKWTAVVRELEVDVSQLILAFLGGDTGELATDALPDQMKALMAAMQGEGSDDLAEQVGGSELKELMGAAGGEVMEAMFKQVSEMLARSIREISLEIHWGREDIDAESVKFVQYVTTDGRLTMTPQPAVPDLEPDRQPPDGIDKEPDEE